MYYNLNDLRRQIVHLFLKKSFKLLEQFAAQYFSFFFYTGKGMLGLIAKTTEG